MEKRDRWLELIDRIQTVVSGISLIMANYAFTASVNLRQIFLQEGLSLYSGPMVDFNLFFFLYRKLSAGLTAVEKFRSDAGRNPLFTSLWTKIKKRLCVIKASGRQLYHLHSQFFLVHVLFYCSMVSVFHIMELLMCPSLKRPRSWNVNAPDA